MNECKRNQPCHVNVICSNTEGSYVCTCHPGYTGNELSCTGTWCFPLVPLNVNETVVFSWHVLYRQQTITLNIIAIMTHFFYLTFQIITSLLDIDECSEAHAVKLNKCHPNASCINTKGSYNCQCNPTYTGNGFKCKGTFGFFEAM